MSRDMAVRLYRETGEKLGPIADATDAEIAVLASFPERVKLSPASSDEAEAA